MLQEARLPYVKLLMHGIREAGRRDKGLAQGMSILGGKLTDERAGEDLDIETADALEILKQRKGFQDNLKSAQLKQPAPQQQPSEPQQTKTKRGRNSGFVELTLVAGMVTTLTLMLWLGIPLAFLAGAASSVII
ncbi:MAG: hypothetical protein JRI96_10840, partial [Deltaproteobacteria bacterium]|nr:hypothetical protein [Deltaproteobacteria bacterium]